MEGYTFIIKNNHPILPKYALLLGSTINLNGELDDPFIDIRLLESSYPELKRELLSKSKKITKLIISDAQIYDYSRLMIIRRIPSGCRERKVINICPDDKYSIQYESDINIEINAYTCFLVLVEPDNSVKLTLLFEVEPEKNKPLLISEEN